MARAAARILLVFGLLTLLAAAPAAAADAGAAPQFHALIERQLDAFAHDDAAAAYALAAPEIRTKFIDAETFLEMVRGKYPPVYRHRSVEFGAMEEKGDAASQAVTIVDNENQVWKALYDLTRQPDGTWLITGCVLIRSTDTAT